MQKEPIDAVITWVDGNDQAHADRLANYFKRMGIARPEGAASTRYNQCGEINYCVKSVFKFAPWIRTIYIVTDAQIPPIMTQLAGTPYEKKIKLIDHRDIFYGFEEVLPVFNSLAIECLLWRISGLSNHFIYFNDDCLFTRNVSPEDFFYNDKIVLRGEWKVQSDKKWLHYLKRFHSYLLGKTQCPIQRDLFRIVEENTAKIAGFNKHLFRFPHAPFALRKRTFERAFQKDPASWYKNMSYAIRSQEQFWPISLVEYIEIKQKNVIFNNTLGAIMVNGACHSQKKIQQRLSLVDKKKKVAFVCLQSMDEAPLTTQSMMLDWLEKSIANP